MQSYKDILTGGGELDFDDPALEEAKQKKYSWDQINTAMTMIGFGPKVIVKLMSALNKVVRDRLTVATEKTTAGNVGNRDMPLGVSQEGNLVRQFNRYCKNMKRSEMLHYCRRLGLSLGHLKDDDIRKSLLGMSLRNKKKFMGTSMGLGMGHVENKGLKTFKQ